MKRILPLCLAALAACRSGGPERVRPLLEADRSFAREVQERRLEGWLAAFDQHGSQVDGEFRPVTGSDAIRAHMGEFFADPANGLWWEPDSASVSEAGNLGSTSGRFRMTRRRPDGSEETVLTGRYFDIWRRLPDGSWKLLYDIGEADAAAAANP